MEAGKVSNKKIFLIIIIATVAFRATSNMLQTSVPLYAKYSVHSSDFIVSLIVTISTLSSLISLFYFGFRRISVWKGVLICLIMTAVTIPAFILTYNQVLLAIVYGFESFWIGSLGMLLLTAAILIGDPKANQNNIAIFTAMLSLSLVLGPIYQAGILSATGNDLETSIILFAPLVVVAAVLFSTLRFDDVLKVGGKLELGFIRNRSFWLGVAVNESLTFPFILTLTFGGIFAKNNFNIGYSEIEALFGVFFFISFVTRLFVVREQRFSRYAMILSTFAATFIGLVAMYLSSNLVEFMIGIILIGYSHGITYPIGSTYVSSSVPKEKLVQANSVYIIIMDADYLIATPIIGLLSESIGIRSTMVLIELPVFAIFLCFLALSRGTVHGRL